jgi:hypothetical protein
MNLADTNDKLFELGALDKENYDLASKQTIQGQLQTDILSQVNGSTGKVDISTARKMVDQYDILPDGVKEDLRQEIDRYEKQYGNDFAQAYRLYTLALAGSAELASMNRLRETVGISNESKLRLAASYALVKQNTAGMSLLSKSFIDEQVSDNDYYHYYYGSAERNRAMALETLILLGQKQKAFAMATKLAKNLSSHQWMSTQTTAYGLYAMAKFAKSNGPKGVSVSYSNAGKPEVITTNKTIAQRGLSVKMGSNSVTIKNNKKNTLFVRVLNSGILPVGSENRYKIT